MLICDFYKERPKIIDDKLDKLYRCACLSEIFGNFEIAETTDVVIVIGERGIDMSHLFAESGDSSHSEFEKAGPMPQ
jgi:hypothetical protein